MPIDLTLDRIRDLAQHLPTYSRPTFHIAGTNGKGSVSAIITSILRSSSPSLSVGRFNSPHLVSIYDCIVINDQIISKEAYSNARARVEHADQKHGTRLSSFELLTLTALVAFEEAKVDFVVLEVGMGGRLDATNVIPDSSVIVSALTAVDLDHQAFLGNSPVEIAKEKAGIARKGRPFVIGFQKHAGVRKAVEEYVTSVGGYSVQYLPVAKRAWSDKDDGPAGQGSISLSAANFRKPPAQPVRFHMPCFSQEIDALLPLYGNHQIDNLGTALAAISALLTHPSNVSPELRLRITPETISRGIHTAHWPGRLSFHVVPARPPRISRPLVVLADGAHNHGSSVILSGYITHLLSSLEPGRSVNLTYIISLSHSPPKTALDTLSPLFPPRLPPQSHSTCTVSIACIEFTPPEGMPWVISVPPIKLRDDIETLMPDAEIWTPDNDASRQIDQALEWVSNKEGEGLVIVTGSLYLVADLYRFIAEK